MPEITAQRSSTNMCPVIEDANLNRNRIFVEGYGHDTTTLAPLWMQKYHFNHTETYTMTYDNFVDWGIMTLEKGTIQCWGNGDTQHYDLMIYDSYHRSLDPAFFPAKRSWRTNAGRHYYTVPGRNGAATGDTHNDIHMTADDATSGTVYRSSWGDNVSQFCYEDVTNNRMWGLFGGRTDQDRVRTWTSYENGLNSMTSPIDVNNARLFFMGTDNAGWVYFTAVNNGSNTTYNIYKINPASAAVTTLISGSYRNNNTSWMRNYPSNIRRDSSSRRVFYSSHYEGTYQALAPIRYVWDPAAGTVTATNCTVNYAGADTFSTHAARFTTEGADGYDRNSWHSKGHQFTVNGVNYITFWITDKSANAGQGSSRWSSAAKRTMMTYSIGASTGDDVLTFHSKFTFASVNDIPRDFLPINSAGTQVVVPVVGSTKFFTFNSTDGWVETGTYPAEMRQLGLDQSNRLWGVSREKGYQTVHILTPTQPVTISVALANSSYTFTGNNISTTANVNAYNSAGNRIAANLNLSIDGSSMIFASNSSKNLTVATSDSGNTTVNLTITGGGVNNIIASVDI